MRHMIPLLVCSFILVNAVSGYLNAAPQSPSAAKLKIDPKTTQEQWQMSRVSRSLARDERVD